MTLLTESVTIKDELPASLPFLSFFFFLSFLIKNKRKIQPKNPMKN